MTEFEWHLLEDKKPIESIDIGGVAVRAGDAVLLRPREGGDIFDSALAGRTAIVEGIEQDYEGQTHVAVVLRDDPGRDFGLLRHPAHRFFFRPSELEAVTRGGV